MKTSLLTIEEREKIILAVCGGMSLATEGDMTRAIKWAERVRTEGDILALVLAGALHIRTSSTTAGRMNSFPASRTWKRRSTPGWMLTPSTS